MYPIIGHLRGPGSIPSSITLPTRLEPAWQKMAQSPFSRTTQPVDIDEEDRSSNMDRQWLR